MCQSRQLRVDEGGGGGGQRREEFFFKSCLTVKLKRDCEKKAVVTESLSKKCIFNSVIELS